MSYCRFGEADVYVFEHVGGFIVCCMCSLGEDDFHADTAAAMDDHLRAHVAAGDFVPDDIIGNMAEPGTA